MGAAEQSSDPIIALFSLATKEHMQDATKEAIKIANELQVVYDEFKNYHRYRYQNSVTEFCKELYYEP